MFTKCSCLSVRFALKSPSGRGEFYLAFAVDTVRFDHPRLSGPQGCGCRFRGHDGAGADERNLGVRANAKLTERSQRRNANDINGAPAAIDPAPVAGSTSAGRAGGRHAPESPTFPLFCALFFSLFLIVLAPSVFLSPTQWPAL
jgi:hypothetical protein